MCWAELVLASVFNPRASFLGHLAGILAGLLHVKVLAPALTRAVGTGGREGVLFSLPVCPLKSYPPCRYLRVKYAMQVV